MVSSIVWLHRTRRLAAVGLSLLFAGAAHAQATAGSITGKITDSKTGTPIVDVTIQIANTQLAAETGPDGTYRIARVPNGTYSLIARRIGYAPLTQTVVVRDNGTASANFALRSSAVNLSEVVVTGTVGNQTRAAQSAVVSVINAPSIVATAPVTNVTELLEARVPGVNITQSSGTLGASSRTAIRGIASISLSNEPLVFIDGVRMNTGFRPADVGGEVISGLDDLNPADIESIEVVKGPAAATLYGADASAGVIQIITKKGRLGSKHFTQSITAEYANIDPNFTPEAVYGTCSAAMVGAGGPAICQGLSAGTVVHVNPLDDADVFKNGHAGSLNYNGQGGGDNFSYYISALVDNEQGTQVNNSVVRRTGRASFTWAPTAQLSLNASLGVARNDYKLPQGDQAAYAPLINQGLSSPFGPYPVNIEGLQNILTESLTLRQTPTAQVNYSPFSWFTNRLTLGGDFSNTQYTQFYPKNNQNWYSGFTGYGSPVNGLIVNRQNSPNIYTVDYQGNIKTSLFGNQNITSNLSFGSQFINSVDNLIQGVGVGLTTNLSNLVGSAATTTADQRYTQAKQFGLYAQEQLGFGDRLYLQGGLRADRSSAFGNNVGTFIEPKVGASYLISKEAFWQHLEPVFSSMRLRASYGTTGRSPPPGTALQTYTASSYLTDAGTFQSGFTPASPGNPDLKPETGKEFEGGIDAGFFHERAALELTYYHKVSDNVLVQRPIPASLGFSTSPYVNLGKVLNRGFEFTLRATPVDTKNFGWDLTYNGATNHNEILSLGNSAAFFGLNQWTKFAPGLPISAWAIPRIVRVDQAAGVAYVSDTAQFAGNQVPTFTQSLSNSFTLFRNLRISTLFDGRFGYKVYNIAGYFRDNFLRNTAEMNYPAGQGGYSDLDRIKRTGPFVDVVTGNPTSSLDAYIQSGNFVRFRELSATLTLPARFAQQFHASNASITVGGRNLHLWTNFEGPDPEVIGGSEGTIGTGKSYLNVDLFTIPQSRRVFTRLNLTF